MNNATQPAETKTEPTGPSATDLAYDAAEDALAKLKHQLNRDLSDQAMVVAGLETALAALNRSRRA